MSMRSLESAICAEARIVFNNRRLRVKDMLEWSTSTPTVEANCKPGEVWANMPRHGVSVCIIAAHDGRKPKP